MAERITSTESPVVIINVRGDNNTMAPQMTNTIWGGGGDGAAAERCNEIARIARADALNPTSQEQSRDYYGTVTNQSGQVMPDQNYVINHLILPPLRKEGDKVLKNLGIAPDQIRDRATSFLGIGKKKDSPSIEQANPYNLKQPPKARFGVDGLGINYGTPGKTIGFNGTNIYFRGTNNNPTSSSNFYIGYDVDKKEAWGTLNVGF